MKINFSKLKILVFIILTFFNLILAKGIEHIFVNNGLILFNSISYDPLINRGIILSKLFSSLSNVELNLIIVFSSISCLVIISLFQLFYSDKNWRLYEFSSSMLAAGILGNAIQRIVNGVTFDYIKINLFFFHDIRFNFFDLFQIIGLFIFTIHLIPIILNHKKKERRKSWPKLHKLGYALLNDLIFCILFIIIGNFIAIVSIYFIACQSASSLNKSIYIFISFALLFQFFVFTLAWIKFSQICDSVNGFVYGIERFIDSVENNDQIEESNVIRQELYSKYIYSLLIKIRNLKKHK